MSGVLAPIRFKAAELSEDGTFSGYGSVFGVKDSYNEIVAKGAFAEGLKAGHMPKLLWQHDSSRPAGVYTKAEEDDHGLYLEGKLALDVPDGMLAYRLLKIGAVDGLSIGYVATEWTTDSETDTVTLDKIDLWEVSIVTFPANSEARIDGVKSALRRGALPRAKDIEKYLRDGGFSQTEAKHGANLLLRDLEAAREGRSKTQPPSLTLADALAIINH